MQTGPSLRDSVVQSAHAVLYILVYGGSAVVLLSSSDLRLAAPILIGLGVTSLSSTTGQIAAVKAVLANITLEECQTLAKVALAASSASDVRALLLGKGET